jgi:hypothetical protein
MAKETAIAMAMVVAAGCATPAFAGDLDYIATTIAGELSSTMLQTIGAVAILGIAFLWMTGVLRPITAFVVATGIGLAAESPTIAGKLFGSS